MLSLDFSCSGKGEPLFGTGISLHFWHFALVFCKLFSLDNQPDIAFPQKGFAISAVDVYVEASSAFFVKKCAKIQHVFEKSMRLFFFYTFIPKVVLF